MLHDLSAMREDEGFRTTSGGRLVLDDRLVIRAANAAYLRLVQRAEEELISVPVFEAFPDNPEAAESDGHANMAASFEQVLRRGKPHHLLMQRYDTLDRASGEFQERYWVPVNVPVQRDGRVVGVEVRVDEVRRPTPAAVRAMRALRDALSGGIVLDDDPGEGSIRQLVESIEELDQLAREADQLREALTSRATIDQAKGIVMAQRGLGPDEAWAWLVKVSNDTNVRVADVAAALVYQVRRPATEPDRAADAGPAGSD